MADYTFEGLSSFDFERLSRDLLQKYLNIHLESFGPGPDNGIDLRCVVINGPIIVQCKHYARAGWSSLFSLLKTEAAKVDKLRPKRYILVTSVSLTPERKQKIIELFSPYIKSSSDIFGCEDVNNLLTQFPKVELAHFKLWLTSTSILERAVNGKIFGRSEALSREIREELLTYVPNPSYSRARTILDESNHCMIVGMPGIGKTLLAKLLWIHFSEKEGYSCFRITSDADEAFSNFRPGEKQFFYYDDFLGQVSSAEKLGKNEDDSLVSLLTAVRGDPHKKMVLTTREYLLNQAYQRYEKLLRYDSSITKCVVEMQDYQTPVRAELLFNHLYFADIPPEFCLDLMEDDLFHDLILHRNFLPRLVRTAIEKRDQLPGKGIGAKICAAFENPQDIWDHPFRRQFSEAARCLALVFFSLPSEIDVSILQTAFDAYYSFESKQRNFQIEHDAFRLALKELNGNFICSYMTESGNNRFYFYNPSVRDYLKAFTFENPRIVRNLMESAIFFEQLQILYELGDVKEGKKIRGWLSEQKEKLANLFETLLKATPISPATPIDTLLERLRWILHIEIIYETGVFSALIERQIPYLIADSELMKAKKYLLVNFASDLKSSPLPTTTVAPFLSLICEAILKIFNSAEDVIAASSFASLKRDPLTSDERESLRELVQQFFSTLNKENLKSMSVDLMDELYESLKDLSRLCRTPFRQQLTFLRLELAERWQNELDDPYSEEARQLIKQAEEVSVKDLRALFQLLIN